MAEQRSSGSPEPGSAPKVAFGTWAPDKATLPAYHDYEVPGAPSPAPQQEVHLVVLAGNHVGRVFTLRPGANAIGRDETAEVQIMDAGISRRHASVFCDPQTGKCDVQDVGSRNGTRLNGVAVQGRCQISAGDKIELGQRTVLRVSFGSELETQYAQQMYEAVLRDGLTGAFNRKYLNDRLKGELAFALRHRTPLSLLMLDIDHFKKINDTYGHQAGDYVLKGLAELAQQAIRAEDVFARYGGEEFAIICRDTDEARATILAERIREGTRQRRWEFENQQIPVTLSIGVSDLKGGVDTVEKLVEGADQALYAAKNGGRDRTVQRSSF